METPEALLYSGLINENLQPPKDYVPLAERKEKKRRKEMERKQEEEVAERLVKENFLHDVARDVMRKMNPEELRRYEKIAVKELEVIKRDIKGGRIKLAAGDAG